jgi:hypothetical protein
VLTRGESVSKNVDLVNGAYTAFAK